MQITFIDSRSGGFGETLTVQDNTRIDDFLVARTGSADFAGTSILVNREPVARTYVLQDGDRVVIGPREVKGA